MRGVHSIVDDIRRNVFEEVARLAYEGGDLSRIDLVPYKIIPGEAGLYPGNVFTARAIVEERLRLACGLNVRTAADYAPPSYGLEEANKPEKYYEPPLVNVIKFAVTPVQKKKFEFLPIVKDVFLTRVRLFAQEVP